MSRLNSKGFTLIEVFATVSLLAVVLALGILRYDKIVEAMSHVPTEQVVSRAVREGHLLARQRQENVYLSFDKESATLRLAVPNRGVNREYGLRAEGKENQVDVRLFRIKPEEKLTGDMAFEREDEEVQSIVLHPSGASARFAIFIEDGLNQRRLYFDPFSNKMTEGNDADL